MPAHLTSDSSPRDPSKRMNKWCSLSRDSGQPTHLRVHTFSSRAVQFPPISSPMIHTTYHRKFSVQDPPRRNRTNMLSAAACLPYQSKNDFLPKPHFEPCHCSTAFSNYNKLHFRPPASPPDFEDRVSKSTPVIPTDFKDLLRPQSFQSSSSTRNFHREETIMPVTRIVS